MKSVEPTKEFYSRVIFGNKILQMEKVHITFKVHKQVKKRLISTKALIERTGIPLIISSDTFKSEIDPMWAIC